MASLIAALGGCARYPLHPHLDLPPDAPVMVPGGRQGGSVLFFTAVGVPSLMSLSETTTSRRWRFAAPGPCAKGAVGPAAWVRGDDDAAFFLACGRAWSIELDSGTRRWEVELGDAAAFPGPREGTVQGDDETFVLPIGAGVKRFRLLDPDHGGRDLAVFDVPPGTRAIRPTSAGAAFFVHEAEAGGGWAVTLADTSGATRTLPVSGEPVAVVGPREAMRIVLAGGATMPVP
jgi:hypothetical protein